MNSNTTGPIPKTIKEYKDSTLIEETYKYYKLNVSPVDDSNLDIELYKFNGKVYVDLWLRDKMRINQDLYKRGVGNSPREALLMLFNE